MVSLFGRKRRPFLNQILAIKPTTQEAYFTIGRDELKSIPLIKEELQRAFLASDIRKVTFRCADPKCDLTPLVTTLLDLNLEQLTAINVHCGSLNTQQVKESLKLNQYVQTLSQLRPRNKILNADIAGLLLRNRRIHSYYHDDLRQRAYLFGTVIGITIGLLLLAVVSVLAVAHVMVLPGIVTHFVLVKLGFAASVPLLVALAVREASAAVYRYLNRDAHKVDKLALAQFKPTLPDKRVKLCMSDEQIRTYNETNKQSDEVVPKIVQSKKSTWEIVEVDARQARHISLVLQLLNKTSLVDVSDCDSAPGRWQKAFFDQYTAITDACGYGYEQQSVLPIAPLYRHSGFHPSQDKPFRNARWGSEPSTSLLSDYRNRHVLHPPIIGPAYQSIVYTNIETACIEMARNQVVDARVIFAEQDFNEYAQIFVSCFLRNSSLKRLELVFPEKDFSNINNPPMDPLECKLVEQIVLANSPNLKHLVVVGGDVCRQQENIPKRLARCFEHNSALTAFEQVNYQWLSEPLRAINNTISRNREWQKKYRNSSSNPEFAELRRTRTDRVKVKMSSREIYIGLGWDRPKAKHAKSLPSVSSVMHNNASLKVLKGQLEIEVRNEKRDDVFRDCSVTLSRWADIAGQIRLHNFFAHAKNTFPAATRYHRLFEQQENVARDRVHDDYRSIKVARGGMQK